MKTNSLTSESTNTSQNAVSKSATILATKLQPTAYTPIWIMRQAGRYMPSYRKLRGKAEFLELCKNSDLAAEITLLPIKELGVDAAIIFSDILLILEPLGAKLRFASGEGPIIDNPITIEEDVYRLNQNNIKESLSYVFLAIDKTRKVLDPGLPLIGFSGAPFTLAAYLIEGGKVGNLAKTKNFMYSHPQAWYKLLDLLTQSCSEYLSEQIKAGADIIQIFDSWVGSLSPADFSQYVLAHSKKLVSAIKDKVPTIYFGTSTGSLMSLISQTNCQVIGMDWRVDIANEWKNLQHKVAVQGNLDPIVLLSDKDTITQQAKRILKEVNNKPGHIFNLGHGVLPETPIDNVKYLVDFVKSFKQSAQP